MKVIFQMWQESVLVSLWSIPAQGFNNSQMRSTEIKVSSKTKPCNKRQLEVINYLLLIASPIQCKPQSSLPSCIYQGRKFKHSCKQEKNDNFFLSYQIQCKQQAFLGVEQLSEVDPLLWNNNNNNNKNDCEWVLFIVSTKYWTRQLRLLAFEILVSKRSLFTLKVNGF